ncbi:MAG: hypothetical protein ACTSX1_00115 [Candidatus Heimdallarchaeaceae archaeon]
MSTESDKLRSMVNVAPEQVDNLNNSISQIEDLMEEVAEEISAIEDSLMGVSESDLITYLEDVKIPEISADSTALHRFQPGPTFGSSTWGPPKGNISDWAIQALYLIPPTPPPILPPVPTWVNVYVYLGVGWDGDTTVTTLITDYDFGNDYLWKPLTDGASYGRYPYYGSLNVGKGYLTNNRDKVNNSINVFQDYAT